MEKLIPEILGYAVLVIAVAIAIIEVIKTIKNRK